MFLSKLKTLYETAVFSIFAMAAAIGLREDFGSGRLRALAKMVKDAAQARRLLALAVIYDGGRRTEAARIGGVGL